MLACQSLEQLEANYASFVPHFNATSLLFKQEVTRLAALGSQLAAKQANTPISIDVTTDKRYRQPGCSRLKVTFWQDGVWLPGAQAPRKQSIEFGINYCLDGLPPKSLQ